MLNYIIFNTREDRGSNSSSFSELVIMINTSRRMHKDEKKNENIH